jgi:hypothetical protein
MVAAPLTTASEHPQIDAPIPEGTGDGSPNRNHKKLLCGEDDVDEVGELDDGGANVAYGTRYSFKTERWRILYEFTEEQAGKDFISTPSRNFILR